MKTITTYTMALLTGAFLIACNDDDDPSNNVQDLTLNASNLPTSLTTEAYEGWIIVEGAPVSTGTFTVDASGTPSQSTFSVDRAMLESATAFVLSIEPVPDTDPAPSNIKILGGDFAGSSANLSASHAAALGTDLGSAMGNYILATPTTATDTDELSGLWFLDLSSGSPAVGLTLPDLGSNWKYEGWAVIDGTPVTSGTFSDVDVADDSAPFSGPDPGPPFPGEDFVSNAPVGLSFPTDLTGSTVVISIEPSPDNDPSPFLFKPLIASVSNSAQDHVTYAMDNQVSSNFPTGSATR